MDVPFGSHGSGKGKRAYADFISLSGRMSLTANDIMNAPAVVTTEKASVRDVAKLMKKHNVDSVVVVNTHEMPIGIITEGDIVHRLVSAMALKSRLFVKAKHIMSKPVVTTLATITLAEAMKKMNDHKVRRLCVVNDNNKVVGLLSAADITENASYMINTLQEVIRTIDSAGVVQQF